MFLLGAYIWAQALKRSWQMHMCEKGCMNWCMNRWIKSCRDVDRVDKWAEDECCPPSQTENSWPSNPVRWQSNLFKETGSTFHPKGRLNLVQLCCGSLGCIWCYVVENGLWTHAGYAIKDYCSIATGPMLQLFKIIRSWFYYTTPHTYSENWGFFYFLKTSRAHCCASNYSTVLHNSKYGKRLKLLYLKPNLLFQSPYSLFY